MLCLQIEQYLHITLFCIDTYDRVTRIDVKGVINMISEKSCFSERECLLKEMDPLPSPSLNHSLLTIYLTTSTIHPMLSVKCTSVYIRFQVIN